MCLRADDVGVFVLWRKVASAFLEGHAIVLSHTFILCAFYYTAIFHSGRRVGTPMQILMEEEYRWCQFRSRQPTALHPTNRNLNTKLVPVGGRNNIGSEENDKMFQEKLNFFLLHRSLFLNAQSLLFFLLRYIMKSIFEHQKKSYSISVGRAAYQPAKWMYTATHAKLYWDTWLMLRCLVSTVSLGVLYVSISARIQILYRTYTYISVMALQPMLGTVCVAIRHTGTSIGRSTSPRECPAGAVFLSAKRTRSVLEELPALEPTDPYIS